MADAASVIELMTRLTNEVARLGRDVVVLRDRVEPFEGERLVPYRQVEPIMTDKDLLRQLAEMRADIRSCEYHLTAIRGAMDDICKDAISRAEMKPYLKDK